MNKTWFPHTSTNTFFQFPLGKSIFPTRFFFKKWFSLPWGGEREGGGEGAAAFWHTLSILLKFFFSGIYLSRSGTSSSRHSPHRNLVDASWSPRSLGRDTFPFPSRRPSWRGCCFAQTETQDRQTRRTSLDGSGADEFVRKTTITRTTLFGHNFSY